MAKSEFFTHHLHSIGLLFGDSHFLVHWVHPAQNKCLRGGSWICVVSSCASPRQQLLFVRVQIPVELFPDRLLVVFSSSKPEKCTLVSWQFATYLASLHQSLLVWKEAGLQNAVDWVFFMRSLCLSERGFETRHEDMNNNNIPKCQSISRYLSYSCPRFASLLGCFYVSHLRCCILSSPN